MKGKIAITTQPVDISSRFTNTLALAGVKAHHLPMIKIEFVQPNDQVEWIFNSLKNFNILVFTSKNGVAGFFHLLDRIAGNYKLPENLKIAVIGKSTAEEVRKYYDTVHYINSGTTSADFSDYLINEVVSPDSNILFALGNLAPHQLQNNINRICESNRINVYNTIKPDKFDDEILKMAVNQKADLLIFNSPSAFKNFIEITGLTTNELKTEIACIGQTTGSYIQSEGYRVNLIATNPAADFFAQDIINYLNKSN